MTLILSGTDGLSDVDGSAATPAIRGTDANTGIFFPAADTIAFSEGGTESMRIDSSGNVGVGVTPSAWEASTAIQVVNGYAYTKYGMSRNTYYDGTNYRYITTAAASTYEQSGGVHSWRTAASGTAGNTVSFTETMRIDSSGNLQVGSTSFGSGTTSSRLGAGNLSIRCNVSTTYEVCNWVNSNGQVGTISLNGTSTSYNTSSDYRLKHDIAPMTGALAKVAALKPVTYKWNADNSAGEGFIAHELAEVAPQCVTGEKDAVETYTDEEGNEQTRPKYQGIDTSFLVATLTAAIQEQQAIIQSLTARIEALEGK